MQNNQRGQRPAEASLSRTGQSGESCYLAFLAILSALKALGFYEGQRIFTLFLVIACLFLVAKILLTGHTLPEYAAILLLLGIGALVYLNTGEKGLLVIMMVLVGIKGVPVRNAMKVFLAVWGCCYTLLTVLSLFGIHEDQLYMHDKKGFGYILCHSLGYTHSNVLHTNFLCICAMVLFLSLDRFDRKRRLALSALLAGLNLYVFLYSMSYTGLLGSAALLFLYVYVTVRPQFGRMEKILAELVLPLCAAFSLIGPLVIRGRLFDLINSALNTRYELTRWFLTSQPITLFGTRMDIFNYRYTLDCSYAYLFMTFGVIPFAILMLLYAGTIHRMVRNGRTGELSILLGLLIGGIAEPYLFNLGFKNASLLFVGEYLYWLLGAAAGKIRLPGRTWCAARLLPRKGASNPSGEAAFADTAPDCEEEHKQDFGKKRVPVQHAEQVQKRNHTGILLFLSGRICRFGGEILDIWMQHGRRFLLLAAAICVILGGAAHLLRPAAERLYINSSVNEEHQSDRYCEYFTEEEADAVREEGDFLFGYIDEEEPMYLYTGNAPLLEYWRIVISCGVLPAILVCVLLAAWLRARPATLQRRQP